MAVVELEIPPRAPFVGVVRLALASLARSVGLDEERVGDMKIAVSEACANAVLAHEERALDDPISVRWEDTTDRVIVEIGDRGSIPTNGAGDVDTQGIATRHVMSLALLKSLVSSCEFSERPGGGSLTRLAFDR
ncbi:MAG: ATP-binding protein [Actinomycetota bacterium]|nr:ATP-binding protein [Actinomycetota bacterium]